jgi:hypothetical protein
MKDPPQIAIVILNWNNGPDVIECVESLRKSTYVNYRIYIADNGSSDNSVDDIQNAYPDIPLILNRKNKGFAGGNNPGIEHALEHGADFVLLLNNDTTVAPDFLGHVVCVAESDPATGIVSPKIYYYSEPGRLWFAGGVIDLWKGHTRHLGDLEVDQGQYDHVADVDFVSGCAMLIKRKVIEDIGMLYEPMFLYYEDSDFCARARHAGYRIVMAPEAKIWHKVSSTTGKIKDLQWFYGTRNMLIFEKRNASPLQLAFFLPYYAAKFVLYNALSAALSGDLKKSRLILKAAVEGLLT